MSGRLQVITSRRFVVVGRTASATGDFVLDDVPGSSGRLDVLLRCVRAALLFSHGVRKDAVVYLVLLGTARRPRAVRIDGATAAYLRPDERSLAVLLKKSLVVDPRAPGFTLVRPGIALAEGGLEPVLADLGPMTPYVLDERATDLREAGCFAPDAAFFFGDHLGLDDATRARLDALGARALSLGPTSLHADDAVAILQNELDRRERAG